MARNTINAIIEGAWYKLPNDITVSSMRVSEIVPAGTKVKVLTIITEEFLEVKTMDYGRFQIHIEDLVDTGYPGDDTSPEPPHADYWSEG